MKNLSAILLLAALALSMLSGCSGGEQDAPAGESSQEDVIATPDEEPEESEPQPVGRLAEYVVGDVTLLIPASYQATDYSQTVEGIQVNVLYISNDGHMAAVSSTSFGTSSGFMADDEESLDAAVDGMIADLAGQGGKPSVKRQGDTSYVKFADEIWAHRNLVVKAGGEYAEIDVYINNVPDGQNGATFLTVGDRHISGSNDAMIQTVLGSMTLGADEELPGDDETGDGQDAEDGEDHPDAAGAGEEEDPAA